MLNKRYYSKQIEHGLIDLTLSYKANGKIVSIMLPTDSSEDTYR
jgi:hypothetical protein